MGALFSSPKTPTIPVTPPAAAPATIANPSVAGTGAGAKNRAAAAAGGTVSTTPQGLTTPPSTAPATLLGQ
jgi:hypothetical protein